MGYWRAAAAVVCLPAALSLMAFPAAAETVVKIGLINSYTGFVAEAADQAQKAIDLYFKEHERDLPPGVKIELIRRDDTSNPEVGKRLAQELITREHVQLLTGIVLSPVAAAVAPLTAEAKVPLLISIAAAGVAIPRMSPYVARVTVTLWQLGYPIGKWAAEQGWKTGYTAVSDFIPGHDSEAAFTKGFTADGGQMIGTVRFPPNNPDFAPLGIITSGTYSVAGERPANTAFLAAWKREYADKAIPNFLSVDAWDGMAAIFDLIKATKGKFGADEAVAFFRNWKNPDSPRGPIRIDPETRDIVQNVYIRRLDRQSGRLANIEIATIPMVKDPWKELNPVK